MICFTTARSDLVISRPRYLATISMHDTIENQGSERKKKCGLSKKTYDRVRNGNDRPYLLSYYQHISHTPTPICINWQRPLQCVPYNVLCYLCLVTRNVMCLKLSY